MLLFREVFSSMRSTLVVLLRRLALFTMETLSRRLPCMMLMLMLMLMLMYKEGVVDTDFYIGE